MRHPSSAMKQGRAAKADGRPVSANPYRAGCQDSADWLEGYTEDEWARYSRHHRPESEE